MSEHIVGLTMMTAAALGLLSFFEPCTIATHTLFSARAHADLRAARHGALLGLWITRSAFSVGLLLTVVMLTAPPRLHGYWPSGVLSVMATVYLLSRFVYIPVPHLEAWKILPGGAALPQPAKLGLTLPACTLPLFVVVAALSAAHDSWSLAVVSGMLFATLFTAPTAVAALVGVSDAGRRFIRRAAFATPYLTAALLYGGAIYVLA